MQEGARVKRGGNDIMLYTIDHACSLRESGAHEGGKRVCGNKSEIVSKRGEKKIRFKNPTPCKKRGQGCFSN